MQFVIALFPIEHEGIVEHCGTRLVEIGFDAVVYRDFAFLLMEMKFGIICGELLNELFFTREALPMRCRGLIRKERAPCNFLRGL